MLETLVISVFLILGGYGFWYFFKAKTYQPLELNDLSLMWKLHKHRNHCSASTIEKILLKNGEAVGYECSCGYKYHQKRLITQRAHNFANKQISPKISNTLSGFNGINKPVNMQGLPYISVEQI